MHLSLVKGKTQHIITERLIPQEEWPAPELALYENNDRRRFTLPEPSSTLGLTVLVTSYLASALFNTRPTWQRAKPQRIGSKGKSIEDVFKFTCHAITDLNDCCDTNLDHPLAQACLRGEYLITVPINKQTLVLTPANGTSSAADFTADRKPKIARPTC